MAISKSKELKLWESLQANYTIYAAAKNANVDYKTAKTYYKKFKTLIALESEKLQAEIPDKIEKKAKSFLSFLNPGGDVTQ